MKKILFLALLIVIFAGPSNAQGERRLNVSAGVSRSVAVTEKDFHLKQFSGSLSLSYRLRGKWSVNIGLSKSFDRRPPALRAGISLKIY